MPQSFQMEEAAAKQEEFAALSFKHMDSLYNTALRLTRNQVDAEDLVQDVYVRAYRFFHKFQRDTNFRAWIFKILTNTFINHYRKKISQPRKVELEKVSFAITDGKKDIDTGIIERFDDNAYDSLFDDEISTALERLSDEFRIVILLADIECFSYKEIARIVGCPLGTVMSRLSRGRKQLQVHLREYAIRGGYISKMEYSGTN